MTDLLDHYVLAAGLLLEVKNSLTALQTVGNEAEALEELAEVLARASEITADKPQQVIEIYQPVFASISEALATP